MNVACIGVVGAGTMGRGIAEVSARSGFDVRFVDSIPQQIERAMDHIRTSLANAAARGKLADPIDVVSRRLHVTSSLQDLADCDFVIEAIVEDAEIKYALHEELGGVVRPDVIIASNTSSISITRLGEASGRPHHFIGMHFFNPVVVMSLVEVISGRATRESTVLATEDLARRMGKTPVRANDAPGFVANRVLMPMINEAVHALADGVADAKSIDQIMVLGCNHPMGPLALADLIGLDVCVMIMDVLERDTGDVKFRPCPLLRQMVASGKLGKKSKSGFFAYS